MDASSGPVRDMLNVVASTVACRDSFCAEKSAVENTLEGMIQDYMTTRIEMFEDKVSIHFEWIMICRITFNLGLFQQLVETSLSD